MVGAAMALFGGSALSGEPLEGLPIAYVALGAGLFLAFFAVAMLMTRERASIIEIGGTGLGIETLGGQSVTLPWRSLRQALVLPQGDGRDNVVALRKADSGWIELAAFGDDEAAANLAEHLQGHIDSPPDGAPDVIDLARLEGIVVERDGDRTELAWSTTSFAALAALGPLAGMWVAIYGFHRNEPSMGTLAAMGFVAGLAVLVIVFTVINVGAEQRVAVDATTLTIRRRRFGRVIDDRAIELGTIAAVDYSHRLNVLGASSLTIRTDRARLVREGVERRVAEEGDDLEDLEAIELSTALLKAIAGGVHVPLGRLPLSTRIGLDLALSDEIAARSLRAKGSV